MKIVERKQYSNLVLPLIIFQNYNTKYIIKKTDVKNHKKLKDSGTMKKRLIYIGEVIMKGLKKYLIRS